MRSGGLRRFHRGGAVLQPAGFARQASRLYGLHGHTSHLP
jgi:hypothetical protein